MNTSVNNNVRASALQSELRIKFDIGPLDIVSRTEENFDDLIERKQYKSGNLNTLNELRLRLTDGGKLILVNSYNGRTDAAYTALQEILMNKAGFINVEFEQSNNGTTATAVKRPAVAIDIGYGMTIREMIAEQEIRECHDFAEEIYYNKDFNYNYEVARQFDPNADMFCVIDESAIIWAIGRIVYRAPGYNCPFMYATKPDGSHIEVEGDYMRTGEVMGLYREGKKGVVAFKKLMENFAIYAFKTSKFERIWTTYDEIDSFTGTYYRRKLLMRGTGVKLTYRDFGGTWVLIYTDQVKELHDFHSRMFSR
jgi:hypothetical protein